MQSSQLSKEKIVFEESDESGSGNSSENEIGSEAEGG